MIELLIFFTFAAAGGALRFIYFLMRKLSLKTDILAVTIILDAVFCLISLAVFLLINHTLGGGEFRFYMVAGTLIGFMFIGLFK